MRKSTQYDVIRSLVRQDKLIRLKATAQASRYVVKGQVCERKSYEASCLAITYSYIIW